jgi:predicted transcriptional regulator
MKVLSITEPYATLIMSGVKKIETRSWKANYRGELYIHASSTKPKKEVLENHKIMDLIKNEELNYGYIICKANLVDCVYMDDEFIKKIKNNNNEFICGIYEEGRYAWILEDVTVLDKKIKAKGKLNIWNYFE